MKLKIIGLALFVLALAAAPVMAAEVVSPAAGNPSVVLNSQESHKNLYAVGGQVTVNSDTLGDLTTAGGTISVTGKVEQEALIAGDLTDFLGKAFMAISL